jgi:HK97 family phage portal protein
MGIVRRLLGREKKSASALAPGYTLYLSGGNVIALNTYHIHTIIQHYTTVAPLNTAITKIAQAVGSLPYALKNKSTGELVTTHPVLDRLNRPNQEHQKTKRKFFEALITWKLLEGDCYIAATGRINQPPLDLYVLNPRFIQVLPDAAGYPSEYRYQPASQGQTVYRRDLRTNRFITDDRQQELLHIANFNPGSCQYEYEGMSAVVPLYLEVMQYLHASQHNLSLLMNGAQPSGALILKGKDGMPVTLTDDQYKRLKAQLETEFTGANNAGRPMLLEGGMEWQQISFKPKDMDWRAGKLDAEKQIYKRLGVPLPLVTDEKSTYNNMFEAKMDFYESTVIPAAEDVLDYFDTWLLPRYQDLQGQHLVVDVDSMDLLADRRLSKRKAVEENTVLMLNEKRNELGYEDIEGGDAVFTTTGTAMAGPDAEQEQPVMPSKPPFGGKSFEKKDMVQVDQSLDDPGVYAATTELSRQMYAELVTAFGKDMVDELIELGKFEQTQAVQSFIDTTTGEFIRQINKTTKKQLREQIMEGILNGETLPSIAERVGQVFDDARQSRIDTIAVTETTRAAGFAAREALDQAGLARSVWLAVRDGKTRDAHLYLDGRVSDSNGYFHVDGDRARQPGDFASASLNINCRCALRAALPDEKGNSFEQDTKIWEAREIKRQGYEVIVRKYVGMIFAIQKRAALARLTNG